ncbi:MAG: hypothetical protein Nk1A_5250 [Endomicrobiia bacterium]|nr:MAG: hypothetical protein Nk1A_5250 [Endomicrobiia bacterium]
MTITQRRALIIDIFPIVETVHDRLNIEVARDCPDCCHFCQASKYYMSWRRQKTHEKLLSLLEEYL